jgi:hypothetical protein
MAIGNDQELVTAAAQASKLIQNIQDYCGRKLRDDSKHQDILAGVSCSSNARAKAFHFLMAARFSGKIPAIAVLRTDVLERVVLHPIADPLWMRPPQRALSEFTTTIG